MSCVHENVTVNFNTFIGATIFGVTLHTNNEYGSQLLETHPDYNIHTLTDSLFTCIQLLAIIVKKKENIGAFADYQAPDTMAAPTDSSPPQVC